MKTTPLIILALIVGGGSPAATHSNTRAATAASCNVRGVWQSERVTVNGRPFTAGMEVKVVTKDHFMWVQQENRRDTLPLKTFQDTARVYNDAGGYGTYRLSGNNYIERIEAFPDPAFIGKEWPATCHTTRAQWTHSYVSPERTDSTGRMRRDTVVEVFRRVE
jgi:hypothetical protein